MKPSVQTRLLQMVNRYEELKAILSDSAVTHDLNRYRALSKEYAQLEPIALQFLQHQDYLHQLEEAKALLNEQDPELQQLAKLEVKQIEEQIARLEEEIGR